MLSTSVFLAAAPAAADGTLRPHVDQIIIENTTTKEFEGGRQMLIRTGNQAFGVVYGSPEYPNGALTFIGIVVRTLGTATVHDARTGRVVADNVTMPVVTVVAQRFEALVEFRDQRPDGIFDFIPNLSSPDPVDFEAHEPVVKGVSMHGIWNLSDFELDAVSDDRVLINFTLWREDLPYMRVDILERPHNLTLDRIAFTVHLAISRRTVEGLQVPHFDATVNQRAGTKDLESIAMDGTRTVNATITSGRFKVDHDIVGWDAAPNRGDVQSRLLLINGILFLTGTSPQLAPWLNDRAVQGPREGSATTPDENGTAREINESAPSDRFERVRMITLHDHWRGVGGLSWNQSVDVYATPDQVEPRTGDVAFQVLGGTRLVVPLERITLRGFLLVGGFVYPATWRVYHDPELSAEGIEVQGTSFLPGLLPALVLFVEALLILGAIVAAVTLASIHASKAAKQRARVDAERVRAFKERYRLPPPGAGGVR
jgi:hypothetical protein